MAYSRKRRVRSSRLKRTGRRMRGASAFYPAGAAFPNLKRRTRFTGTFRKGRNAQTVGIKRRSRGGSNTITKKRKTIGDPAGYLQWTRHEFQRKLGNWTQRKDNWKDRASVQYIWRNLARLDGQGAMYMSHWNDANQIAWPCYIWELNQLPGQTTHAACLAPSRVVTGVRWDNQNGYDNAGVLNPYWQQFKGDAPVGTTSRFLFKWASAQFDLWGAKANPAEYTVSLIQFKDDDVVPVQFPAVQTDVSVVNFWDRKMKRLTYNPIATDPLPYSSNRIKTIWSQKFMINPTSTTENDADPHCKTIKCFWRFNRRTDFNWKSTDSTLTTLLSVETVKFDNITSSEHSVQVAPRARIYVMIEATKFFENSSYAVQNSTNTPSINAQLRTCFDMSE